MPDTEATQVPERQRRVPMERGDCSVPQLTVSEQAPAVSQSRLPGASSAMDRGTPFRAHFRPASHRPLFRASSSFFVASATEMSPSGKAELMTWVYASIIPGFITTCHASTAGLTTALTALYICQ